MSNKIQIIIKLRVDFETKLRDATQREWKGNKTKILRHRKKIVDQTRKKNRVAHMKIDFQAINTFSRFWIFNVAI